MFGTGVLLHLRKLVGKNAFAMYIFDNGSEK
jgi:hypothetical protein